VFEFWPSDLAQVFARAGIPRRKPPRAECQLGVAGSGQAPRLTSPLKGTVYTLRAQSRGEDRIAFNAIADADVAAALLVRGRRLRRRPRRRATACSGTRPSAATTTCAWSTTMGAPDSRELRIAAVE
jgi:hypothetical protein